MDTSVAASAALGKISAGSFIGQSLIGILLLILVVSIILFLYLIPAFVAGKRRHKNKTAILMLNIFLGWTFVGWIISLVWACTNPADNIQIINNISSDSNMDGSAGENKDMANKNQ